MQTNEENNYPKAFAISTGIMAGMLALSFFLVIGAFEPPKDVGMGGMVVNYGTSVEGMGTDYTSIEEPSVAENANNQMPDKITPEQQVTPTTSSQISDKDIATQNSEDAVSVNTKDKKSNSAPTSAKETKPAEQTINQNALYKGKKNNGSGQGDGTGNTPGNQGSINGDPLAPNYGEGGSGPGNNNIPLNKFVNLQIPEDSGQERGKIVIKVFYNKAGKITNAQVDLKGSTSTNIELQQKCLRSVRNASLKPDEKNSNSMSGKVIFNFDLN